jgi:hypothetical protein
VRVGFCSRNLKGRSGLTWEVFIKMDDKYFEYIKWIHLAQFTDYLLAVTNAAIKLGARDTALQHL